MNPISKNKDHSTVIPVSIKVLGYGPSRPDSLDDRDRKVHDGPEVLGVSDLRRMIPEGSVLGFHLLVK